jgi:flagellar motor switch protein FliM
MSPPEEENLTAAWGEALAQDDAAAPALAPDSTRVLNQAEIDSLLGFGSEGAKQEDQTGIQRIVSAGLVS